MSGLHHALRDFQHALVLFSRISPGKGFVFSDSLQARAVACWPLIGFLLASISSLVWWLLEPVFGHEIAVLLAMSVMVLLTGAMHEDGFADYADSLGVNGREHILRVMKDSSLGSFGVIALFFVLLGRYLCLWTVGVAFVPVFVIAQSLSRMMAMSVMLSLDYVRTDETSKHPGLALDLSGLGLLANLAILLLVALAFSLPEVLFVCLGLWLVRFFMLRQLRFRLGGYTGDCLGALQIMGEFAVYLAYLIAA